MLEVEVKLYLLYLEHWLLFNTLNEAVGFGLMVKGPLGEKQEYDGLVEVNLNL